MADRRRKRFSVDSLFEDTRPQATGLTDLPDAKEIPLDRISPDPDQPRRTIDESRLDELAESIRREGVLQPIVVRFDEASGDYVIVHGERRWRASGLAGRASIPALIRNVPEEHRLVQQLMENIVRDDLNPLDRAVALRALKRQLNDAPWEDVAEAVGIKRSRLFQLLGTEKLPEPIQDDIRAGRLSEKQSRALQNLPPVFQLALRDAIVFDGLTESDATSLAKSLRTITPPDSEEVARGMLDQLRALPAEPKPEAPGRAPAGERAWRGLAAVTAVARGNSDGVPELSAFLSEERVPERAFRKLDEQAIAFAGTLARLQTAKQRDRIEARTTLEALRDAIDAVLSSD